MLSFIKLPWFIATNSPVSFEFFNQYDTLIIITDIFLEDELSFVRNL